MKHLKIARLSGVLIIALLLLAFFPALPASAATLTLATSTASIGSTVTVTGAGYSASQPAGLYLSNQAATLGQLIDTNVTVYQYVGTVTADTNGIISTTFTVPTTLQSRGSYTVVPGTYYLYATILTAVNPATIQALTTLTVQGSGAVTISPTSGAVDSAVTITGSSFAGNTNVSITFGGTPVTVESGATTTTASGTFTSVIAVPPSKAGVQAITVTVGAIQKSANFTVVPDILITPQSGKAGDTVLVSGTGFGRRVVPTIYFNSLPVEPVSPVITDINGSFSASFIVPSSQLSAGVYQVEADDGTNTDTANFTLNASAPPTTTTSTTTTTTTAPTEPVNTADISVVLQGSTAVIIGTSFTPNAPVSILLDDEEIGTATADAEGKIQPTIQLPVVGGNHILKVTDGSVFDTYTYAVESTPPAVPQPLGPGNESKPKAPITFTWEAVTDESLPVTYHLQVSSDEGFAAGDIVLDIEDITSVGYQLTELEQLELAGQAAPYYYRIRAVDAAQNPSTWGPEVAFYVTESAGFPSWAIYTLAGVGGILLFGIGYLVGRRTAFYY